MTTTLLCLLLSGVFAQAQTNARDLYFESDESEAFAIRIAVGKKTAGRARSVNPTILFQSGDVIQFEVSSRGAGYLYVAVQGSDGSWSVLFPGPEKFSTSAQVSARRPVRTSAAFDDKPGEELVYFVYTREPYSSGTSLLAALKQAPAAALAKVEYGNDADSNAIFATSNRSPLIVRVSLRHQ
ncbi:MAG: DUF4384 domain-containing protein [Bryobacterales bacterium]|nr:DUF4384 domain-containing protein [Bryobacterales bacterium]